MAANFAILKPISLNLLKKLDINLSVPVRSKLAGRDNNFKSDIIKTQAAY